MAKILDFGNYVEVVNDLGQRLFCHVNVEKAQAMWLQDARNCGCGNLCDPLPVEIGKE